MMVEEQMCDRMVSLVEQMLTPVTEQWVKRNAETGQFMDVKQNGEPFKGDHTEKIGSLILPKRG